MRWQNYYERGRNRREILKIKKGISGTNPMPILNQKAAFGEKNFSAFAGGFT
ncbi:hypothetical protein [Kamptonema animale]|jgi:hypothetical protein|uniref:hypothetical protein n=1 Tax=Kamptonema animale TaxID=92934 RepID=UPI00232A80ED|nr:hypothetical protein [Kamptonema animale]